MILLLGSSGYVGTSFQEFFIRKNVFAEPIFLSRFKIASESDEEKISTICQYQEKI